MKQEQQFLTAVRKHRQPTGEPCPECKSVETALFHLEAEECSCGETYYWTCGECDHQWGHE